MTFFAKAQKLMFGETKVTFSVLQGWENVTYGAVRTYEFELDIVIHLITQVKILSGLTLQNDACVETKIRVH